MLTLKLNAQIEQEFKMIAQKSGKSQAQLLKELVINCLEDNQDIVEAEKVLNDIKKGDDEILTLKEAQGIYAVDN